MCADKLGSRHLLKGKTTASSCGLYGCVSVIPFGPGLITASNSTQWQQLWGLYCQVQTRQDYFRHGMLITLCIVMPRAIPFGQGRASPADRIADSLKLHIPVLIFVSLSYSARVCCSQTCFVRKIGILVPPLHLHLKPNTIGETVIGTLVEQTPTLPIRVPGCSVPNYVSDTGLSASNPIPYTSSMSEHENQQQLHSSKDSAVGQLRSRALLQHRTSQVPGQLSLIAAQKGRTGLEPGCLTM